LWSGKLELPVKQAVPSVHCLARVTEMKKGLQNLWNDQQGQDIAEYAVILAVILVLVVGTIRLVGSNANNAFSSVASSVQ
jgi:Flp pilus assembly pilin Flp